MVKCTNTIRLLLPSSRWESIRLHIVKVLEDVYAGAFFWRWILCGESLASILFQSRELLWGLSVVFIVRAFCAFDRENYLTLAASLIGVTSLIFNAKGNPIGQVLMVLFSLLYGIISYTFAYYGR